MEMGFRGCLVVVFGFCIRREGRWGGGEIIFMLFMKGF